MSYRVPNISIPLRRNPSLRFASRDEARAYLNNLYGRWLKATVVQIVKDPEPVSHCWVDGKLKRLDQPALADIDSSDLDNEEERA